MKIFNEKILNRDVDIHLKCNFTQTVLFDLIIFAVFRILENQVADINVPYTIKPVLHRKSE